MYIVLPTIPLLILITCIHIKFLNHPINNSSKLTPTGVPVAVQYLSRTPGGYTLLTCGRTCDVKVRTVHEHSLAQHMIEKIPLDTSKFIMAPMPGAVISVTVQPGDEVFAGQAVAVLEAMKMQNELVAEKNGIVKSVMVAAGESVAVDDVLVEFE